MLYWFLVYERRSVDESRVLLKLSGETDVPIVGLDWKDERDLAKQWLAQLGNPYSHVAFDAEGRVAIDWGVYGVPETYVIDKNGRIAYRQVGPMQPRDVERTILPLFEKLK